MADAIDISSLEDLDILVANVSDPPRYTHEPAHEPAHEPTREPAPSEDDSVPDLEDPVRPPRPAYEENPAETDPYLMLAYEVRQVWRLSAELRAALAHIKLLADILLRQAPTPGRNPYV